MGVGTGEDAGEGTGEDAAEGMGEDAAEDAGDGTGEDARDGPGKLSGVTVVDMLLLLARGTGPVPVFRRVQTAGPDSGFRQRVQAAGPDKVHVGIPGPVGYPGGVLPGASMVGAPSAERRQLR